MRVIERATGGTWHIFHASRCLAEDQETTNVIGDVDQVTDDANTECALERAAGRRLRTLATLAWLLSEVAIPDGATPAGGVDAADLRAFVGDLVVRLRRLAHP